MEDTAQIYPYRGDAKMIDVVERLVEYLKEYDISNTESPLREIKNNISIDSSVLLQYL